MPDERIGTPEWWIKRLDAQLRRQRNGAAFYQGYYEGDHRLKFATAKFRETFGTLFGRLADNWTAIVVDAVAERLKVNGFRMGDNPKSDEDFWRIWQRNGMDAESQVAFVESLVGARSFALVWSEPGNPGTAEVTIESAEQMVVATEPGRRRRRLAAWKVHRDDYSGLLFGVLYLPNGIYKFQSMNPVPEERSVASDTTRWQRREVRDESWPLSNPLKVVPVVPFHNRERLLRPARSEIADTVPMQDVCNKLLADMLIASEFQSFRQRWVTGIDIPIDPDTKQPVQPFKSAVDRLFAASSENAKFGEFGQVDLSGYIGAIELGVQHIASQSRTPPHYFYLKGNLPSGESIKSAETGLVAKSRQKMLFLGEDLEEIARLAFLVEGEDGKAEEAQTGETIWGDPEYRTEGEHVDAVLKKKALGVPEEMLWEELGYTQTDIARMREIKRKNALEVAAMGLPPRPALELVPGNPGNPGNGQPEPTAVPAG